MLNQMAKNTIKLIATICLLAWASVGYGQSLSERLAEVYNSQIGVTEITSNDGVQIREYIRSTGFDQPIPWCAAFTSWCLNEANVSNPSSAWSPSWFPESNTIRRGISGDTQPAQGDVFGLYYKRLGRIAHVGFIDRWGDGSWVVTVEGNTNTDGGREGHGVYKKRRLKRSIYKVSRWIK